MPSTTTDLRLRAHRARRMVIELAFGAHKGHIGSALSIVDLTTAVAAHLELDHLEASRRSRFALSKGHAATAWYAALVCAGYADKLDVMAYGSNNSLFGTHPDPAQPYTDFMTGSLGQGIGFAVGSAMASKVSGLNFRVFSILSDSELNEGSTWESLHIASQHKLDRLTVILDLNGQQALGMTPEVMNVGDVGRHLESVGWKVIRVDGHDVEAISLAIRDADQSRKPNLIIASTISGYPVSFMMRKVEWHYLPLTEEQYRQSLDEIDQMYIRSGGVL